MARRSGFGVNRIVPWKGAWWVVLAEGVIALVVGLYVLVQPRQAGTWLAQLIGAYFLINSAFAIYAGFSGSGPPRDQPFRLVVGGIGLVPGLLALVQPLLYTTNTSASLTILGVGLLLAGVIDLAGLIIGRVSLATRPGRLLAGGLHVLLGVLLMYLSHGHGRERAPVARGYRCRSRRAPADLRCQTVPPPRWVPVASFPGPLCSEAWR